MWEGEDLAKLQTLTSINQMLKKYFHICYCHKTSKIPEVKYFIALLHNVPNLFLLPSPASQPLGECSRCFPALHLYGLQETEGGQGIKYIITYCTVHMVRNAPWS